MLGLDAQPPRLELLGDLVTRHGVRDPVGVAEPLGGDRVDAPGHLLETRTARRVRPQRRVGEQPEEALVALPPRLSLADGHRN